CRRACTIPRLQLDVTAADTERLITWDLVGGSTRSWPRGLPPGVAPGNLPGREGASTLPGASSRKNGTGAADFACLSHIVQRRQCLQDSLDLGAARLDLEDQRTDRSRVGLRALEQVL